MGITINSGYFWIKFNTPFDIVFDNEPVFILNTQRKKIVSFAGRYYSLEEFLENFNAEIIEPCFPPDDRQFSFLSNAFSSLTPDEFEEFVSALSQASDRILTKIKAGLKDLI